MVTAVIAGATALACWWLVGDPLVRPAFQDYLRPSVTMNGDGVATRTFRSGDLMVSERYFCRQRRTIGSVHGWWADGIVYAEGEVPLRSDDLGCGLRRIARRVPPLPPGHYRYMAIAVVDLNPLLQGPLAVRYPFPVIEVDIVP